MSYREFVIYNILHKLTYSKIILILFTLHVRIHINNHIPLVLLKLLHKNIVLIQNVNSLELNE